LKARAANAVKQAWKASMGPTAHLVNLENPAHQAATALKARVENAVKPAWKARAENAVNAAWKASTGPTAHLVNAEKRARQAVTALKARAANTVKPEQKARVAQAVKPELRERKVLPGLPGPPAQGAQRSPSPSRHQNRRPRTKTSPNLAPR
jgi:hypothetical protein